MSKTLSRKRKSDQQHVKRKRQCAAPHSCSQAKICWSLRNSMKPWKYFGGAQHSGLGFGKVLQCIDKLFGGLSSHGVECSVLVDCINKSSKKVRQHYPGDEQRWKREILKFYQNWFQYAKSKNGIIKEIAVADDISADDIANILSKMNVKISSNVAKILLQYGANVDIRCALQHKRYRGYSLRCPLKYHYLRHYKINLKFVRSILLEGFNDGAVEVLINKSTLESGTHCRKWEDWCTIAEFLAFEVFHPKINELLFKFGYTTTQSNEGTFFHDYRCVRFTNAVKKIQNLEIGTCKLVHSCFAKKRKFPASTVEVILGYYRNDWTLMQKHQSI